MLDAGNLRRRVETRESFITDETNLMEKKKEKEREEGKEGKRMDERKEKKEKYRYTRTYTSVWSAWNRVSFLFRRRVRKFLAPGDYERSHFASENFDYSFSKIRHANLNFVEWKWHNGTGLLSRAEKGVAINIAPILRIGNIAVDKKAISSTPLIQIIIILCYFEFYNHINANKFLSKVYWTN